jgi:protein-disulfide isomerase
MRRYNSTTYSMDDRNLTLTRRHFVAAGSALPIVAAATTGLFSVKEARAEEPVLLDTDHVLGDRNAPIIIIEYASMTCPHCAHFHETAFPGLKENYFETGKAALAFRHFPFDRYAFQASVMAECAGSDKFFALIDILFKRQAEWTRADNITDALIKIGKQSGISQKKFEACLADEKLGESILTQRLVGSTDYGVDSTPTLFIEGEKYEDDRSYTALDEFLQSKM